MVRASCPPPKKNVLQHTGGALRVLATPSTVHLCGGYRNSFAGVIIAGQGGGAKVGGGSKRSPGHLLTMGTTLFPRVYSAVLIGQTILQSRFLGHPRASVT